MNDPTLTCQDEQRREAVRTEDLNGLDLLEVSDDQHTLTVYFLDKAPRKIEKENVRIEGGRRIRDIQVVDLRVHREDDPNLDDRMEVVVDRPGDFSTYTLRVVEPNDGASTDVRMSGFDPRYAQLDFGFKVGCPSDLDCKPQTNGQPVERVEPDINYLAKDYASFRQLILDRLALIMPDWKERHVPDLGVALVEVLAYVGDYLSYYQDAVATEAYLETARQRISVRRHARLVDYRMHEGCNARAWVCVTTATDKTLDPRNFYFITGYDDTVANGRRVLTTDDLRNVPSSHYVVFEPLVEEPPLGEAYPDEIAKSQEIQLYQAHNEIRFYTWGDQECCLPRGATTATLRDTWVAGPKPGQQEPYEPYEASVEQSRRQQYQPPKEEPSPAPHEHRRKLHLRKGDVLIFEEVIGPGTGNPADADRAHRHAVRLTRVEPGEDPLLKEEVTGAGEELPIPIVEIEWAPEDALPFPLCLSTIGPAPACELIKDSSVVRGNVILVDHGKTIDELEVLGTVPEEATVSRCESEGHPAETVVRPGKFRPRLNLGPLTFSQPLPANGPASGLLEQDPREAMPQIKKLIGAHAGVGTSWTARCDLLGSQGQDLHFVAEIDDKGYARLRFGDDELGRGPEAGTEFRARYRVGNSPSGNVGAEAITHVVFRRDPVSGLEPRNPLPSQGGTSPEPLAEAKLFAPHAFREELQRAITADDYARLAERHPKVQRAAATLRWTGSWYEALVAIDPRGDVEADKQLLKEIKEHLYPYRRIGHDLVVARAQYVPLNIELTVCVLPDFLRGHVKAALLGLFNNRALPDGRRGFFHPDDLSFGDGILLSKLIAAAQAAPGVESVRVTRLERYFEEPNHEIENGVLPLGPIENEVLPLGPIENGVLPLGPLEIARLDNDPNLPENGLLKLEMRGGR